MTFSLVALCLLLGAPPDPPAQARLRPGQLALVGAGDIADCASPDDEDTALLVEGILAQSERAQAFTLGDNCYPDGSLEQYARCYEPSWGRFKSRTIPVVGNHEWQTPNAAGFRGYFAGRFTQEGPLWAAVDVTGTDAAGNPVRWHVVVLDSDCDKVGCDERSAQHAFVVQDLKKQNKKPKDERPQCIVAMFHHPRFSSGPHGDATSMVPLWRALQAGGVDLVLSGHDHIYERFPAMTADGGVDDAKGIPSIIVGTGGKSHYPIGFAHAHSQVRIAQTYGVLLLVPERGGYEARFLATDGRVLDVHHGVCR